MSDLGDLAAQLDGLIEEHRDKYNEILAGLEHGNIRSKQVLALLHLLSLGGATTTLSRYKLGHHYQSNTASRDPYCSVCGKEDYDH